MNLWCFSMAQTSILASMEILVPHIKKWKFGNCDPSPNLGTFWGMIKHGLMSLCSRKKTNFMIKESKCVIKLEGDEMWEINQLPMHQLRYQLFEKVVGLIILNPRFIQIQKFSRRECLLQHLIECQHQRWF